MNTLGYLNKYLGDRFVKEVFTDSAYNLDFTVIDVGALSGEFSFAIAPFAKVVFAIEPNSKGYKELEDNITSFDFTNVKPFKIALSDKDGEDTLNNTGRGGDDLGKKEPNSGDTEIVTTQTLPTFMKNNEIQHIDILKIDIEHGEGRVFTADGIEECLKDIDLIIGEHLEGVEAILIHSGFNVFKGSEGNKIFKRI